MKSILRDIPEILRRFFFTTKRVGSNGSGERVEGKGVEEIEGIGGVEGESLSPLETINPLFR